ncbi:SAV_915 family protein [Streptomyces acidiscabies]|uniref:SAV_915 family protein n=1 Tax=Streptomyces acidiscabies TaxID=42234 RepID=UPI000B18FB85|nr:SAV_915 family protein [Streptomyces acidiscabies]
MGTANTSRLLDYLDAPEAFSPEPSAPRRSCFQDYDLPRPPLPPYHTAVFVPAHPRYVDEVPYIVYELFGRPDGDGAMALAFTTPRKLAAALGEAQPWVATSLGVLATGMREHGVTVRLDPTVAPGVGNWTPADLAAYAQAVR